jgi:cytochrome bd-type quinol oxidase subunit 1
MIPVWLVSILHVVSVASAVVILVAMGVMAWQGWRARP